MKRPQVLPLPGNSTATGNFYDQQPQRALPGVEWPGSFELDEAVSQTDMPRPADRPDPSPFKLGGM